MADPDQINPVTPHQKNPPKAEIEIVKIPDQNLKITNMKDPHLQRLHLNIPYQSQDKQLRAGRPVMIWKTRLVLNGVKVAHRLW